MSRVEERRTFTAGEALAAKRRVKIKAGTTTTPAEVEYAGLGEQAIGVTETACALAGLVAVQLPGCGTIEGVASEAFAKGATLYGAASGKISDTSSGSAIGVAVEAATADGDIVEWAPFAVLSTTAGTVSIADAGGFTAAATVEAALAEVYQDSLSAQTCIPIALTSLVLGSTGAPLAVFADGASATPGLELTNSKAITVRWNNHATPTAVATCVAMPQDLDDAAAVVVHALVSKIGATLADATKLTIAAYEQTVGALHDADTNFGGDTGAVVGDATSKTVTELTLTLAAADIHAAPSAITLTVKPKDGTLGTDDFVLHALWMEYTRKILTA